VTLALYMDTHVPHAITQGLRQRGVDVLTAQEDGTDRLDDPELLRRATELNRVVFSFDEDFAKVTAQWQRSGQDFAGVITLRQWDIPSGQCLDELELIAKVHGPDDIRGRLEYLPLSLT